MKGFKPFTGEEIRYLKDHAGLVPLKTIARHMNRSEKSVYRKAYTLAIPTHHLKISRQEAGWIMELALSGMPVDVIAKKFGLPNYSLNLFIDFRRRDKPCP